MKPHWYLTYVTECPVCGRSSVYKERQYTIKPEDPQRRHLYFQTYDWCNE